jgi:hypothetical protein
MPPFSKAHPRPQPIDKLGLIVRVPICEWCKNTVGRKCPGCSRITCFHCLVNFEGGKCTHIAKSPTPSDGWGEECPNPECDGECNVCMGTGMIHSALQKRLRTP